MHHSEVIHFIYYRNCHLQLIFQLILQFLFDRPFKSCWAGRNWHSEPQDYAHGAAVVPQFEKYQIPSKQSNGWCGPIGWPHLNRRTPIHVSRGIKLLVKGCYQNSLLNHQLKTNGKNYLFLDKCCKVWWCFGRVSSGCAVGYRLTTASSLLLQLRRYWCGNGVVSMYEAGRPLHQCQFNRSINCHRTAHSIWTFSTWPQDSIPYFVFSRSFPSLWISKKVSSKNNL